MRRPRESTYPRLVADIGGTNARFAWLPSEGSALQHTDKLPAAAYPTLLAAARDYLARHGLGAPRWCAIGIANPVVGDRVQMTNHAWSFSIAQLQSDLGVERLLVINDFTAAALALPGLPASELHAVGAGQAVPGAPLALIGAGTGLGVSGLIPPAEGRRAVVITGEGGHVTLPATDEREERVIAWLRGRFGHVSAERALSGPGIVNLHRAACDLAGESAPPLDAAQISERAQAGSDARCVEAIDLFFGFLGSVAGNLALSLGALGGLYVGGGIVPRLGDAIDRSRFRSNFQSKGRMSSYLASIPTWVVHSKESPALAGAARALDEL